MSDQPKSDVDAMRAAAETLLRLTRDPGWKILMHALHLEAEMAKEELVDVDAKDATAVQRLQDKVKRFRWFETTANDLMIQGFQAEEADEIGSSNVEEDTAEGGAEG